MGLCVGADENKEGIDFEIRRESIIFTLNEGDVYCYIDEVHKTRSVEIDKKVLLKLIELCKSKKWNKKMFEEWEVK